MPRVSPKMVNTARAGSTQTHTHTHKNIIYTNTHSHSHTNTDTHATGDGRCVTADRDRKRCRAVGGFRGFHGYLQCITYSKIAYDGHIKCAPVYNTCIKDFVGHLDFSSLLSLGMYNIINAFVSSE